MIYSHNLVHTPHSTTAEKLKELAARLGNPSQEEIAAKLGVRREYVSRILNGLEPSDQLKRTIDLLLLHSGDPQTKRECLEVAEMVSEYMTPSDGINDLYAELHAVIDAAIEAAGEDPDRVKYLLEQIRQHLRIPAHWLAGRTSKKAPPATGIVVPKARSGAHREERATG